MVTIFVTKFGDSQNPSPNLVKKLHFLNLFLFLKKITKMVTIFVTKFGEKNHTFLIYFRFFKKITKIVTIIVTKFGDSQNPSPNLVKKIALF